MAKKHILQFCLIVIFFAALSFKYLLHGIPAVFFSDLGGVYPDLILGSGRLVFTYFGGWKESLSSPFYSMDSNLNFVTPLVLFFMQDIWLRVKATQVLQVFLAAVFNYFFSFHLFSDKKIALLSGVFYATTPFFFSMLNGLNALTWSYVLLPAGFLLVEKMFLTRKIYLSILTGIITAIITFFAGFQFIFYIGIPFASYMVIRCVNLMVKRRVYARRYILLVGFSFLSLFAFSSFFLLPTFFEHNPYAQFERETAYRQNDFVTNFYTPDLKEALSLQNKEQIVSAEFGYEIDQIPKRFVYFYIAASTVALLGIAFAFKKNHPFRSQFNYWALIAASASSLFFSFGKHTFLYDFLNGFLPYFWTIRTPGRFLIAFILFVSIMSPLVFHKFLEKVLPKFQNRRIATDIHMAAMFLGLFITFYIAFFFSRTLLTFETVDSMEKHYKDLPVVSKKLSELNPDNDYRVIDLVIEKDGNPHHLKAYSAGQRTLMNSYDVLWRFKDDPNLARILGVLNIKYVITAPWPEWPTVLNAPFPTLENNLENNRDFLLKYASPEGIKIWENQRALPRTYEADPIFVMGPPSTISSVLDLVPDSGRVALFFAGQINSEEDIAKTIEKSKLIVINPGYEKKPSYLADFDWGSVYNSDFYLNPHNYSKPDEAVKNLAYASKKPIIEIKNQEQAVVTDLLSADLFSAMASKQTGLAVEIVSNKAKLSAVGKFGHRLDPEGFDNPSEVVYKITTEKKGRLKINTDAISLFKGNYVKMSVSENGRDYQDILNLEGDETYPDFYNGVLWVSKQNDSAVFLKVESLARKEVSREVYDSRVEKMELAFIPGLEYNYINIAQKELPDIFGNYGDFEPTIRYPGISAYTTRNNIAKGSVVATEIYTPEWFLKEEKNKYRSLPVNIFNNGFLVDNLNSGSIVTVKYGMSLARGAGILISAATIVLLAVFFKKRA